MNDTHSISVSFIVPAYNSADTIQETLESIHSQTATIAYEIIVVDDGSSDSTVELTRQWSEQHQETPVNILTISHQGEAEAMNIGVAAAQGEWIAWVESDVKIAPNWLECLLDDLKDESVAGAGGLLFPAENDGFIARVFGYEISAKIKWNSEYPLHITSANAVYKRKIFEELGPCTKDLGESSFDSEYNQRIRDAGYRLRFNPNAHAWHHFKSSLWDALKRSWWYGYRRPYVRSQVLYPLDRLIGIVVLSSGLLVPALILYFLHIDTSKLLLLLTLLIHFSYSLLLTFLFPRIELILSFPLFLLRNIVFLTAYGCGWIQKWLAKPTS